MTIRDTATGKTAQVSVPSFVEGTAITRANAAFKQLGVALIAEKSK